MVVQLIESHFARLTSAFRKTHKFMNSSHFRVLPTIRAGGHHRVDTSTVKTDKMSSCQATLNKSVSVIYVVHVSGVERRP